MFATLLTLAGRFLPCRLASDHLGRTCQGLSVNRPTCLVTWAVVNLIAVFAPRTSLTNQDVASLGAFALLMVASVAQAPIGLRPGRTTERIEIGITVGQRSDEGVIV